VAIQEKEMMLQTDLFGDVREDEEISIPGLHYCSNYIDEAEQQELLGIIDQQPWLTDLKRRVQHYGYKYDYKARMVTPELYLGPLPDWLVPLAHRLHSEGLFSAVPDQAIINEYLPGQGISAHVDCVPCFGREIASLSLGSACVMEFTHTHHNKQTKVLEPRSLFVLSGPARYEWQHCIPARKSDVIGGIKINRARRVSVTFRKVILNHSAT
jgi:alkylated DNA repair dioxygenase AlkB